ncbi:hypothetical protein [Lysinibacillus sp. FJAT-14222]|uniref:hypothetical protein n=1 Tax=Lysinibacillus sp. FJAT-14222 TaxID=1932366 RepID=UPI0011600D56|nr:hypothetical protein [Lysinibacillus sp. FJAT-14222]
MKLCSARQRNDSNLRESEATATMFYLCESVSGNVLSVRKRSDSNKAPSRNGNQLHAMVMILIFL